MSINITNKNTIIPSKIHANRAILLKAIPMVAAIIAAPVKYTQNR